MCAQSWSGAYFPGSDSEQTKWNPLCVEVPDPGLLMVSAVLTVWGVSTLPSQFHFTDPSGGGSIARQSLHGRGHEHLRAHCERTKWQEHRHKRKTHAFANHYIAAACFLFCPLVYYLCSVTLTCHCAPTVIHNVLVSKHANGGLLPAALCRHAKSLPSNCLSHSALPHLTNSERYWLYAVGSKKQRQIYQ